MLWLNFGSTKTAYPDYNCLWCINEEAKIISVIVPRDLILTTLGLGAQFYSNLSESDISSGTAVGLVFCQSISGEKDSSFFIPLADTLAEQITPIMDDLTKAIINSGNEQDALIKRIEKSDLFKATWKEIVSYHFSELSKLLSPLSDVTLPNKDQLERIPPIQMLMRATHWCRRNPSEADFHTGKTPVFWYTYPDKEFKIDICFSYRLQLRTAFYKPSISDFLLLPITIVALLVCQIVKVAKNVMRL